MSLCRVTAPLVLLCGCAPERLPAGDTGEPPDTAAAGAAVDHDRDTEVCPPTIVLEPPAIDFGEVAVGASASETITVRNVGCVRLAVSEVGVEGDPFSLGPLSAVLLPPDGAATFSVHFAPTVPGEVGGRAVVESDGSAAPAEVLLSGRAP